LFFDCPWFFLISIIKQITARFIDISAKLKIGKLIGIISKKSSTYPLKNLSIPFPIVPPKRYDIPTKFQKDLGGDFIIIINNNNEVKILINVRRSVELLKRLNAAPLFLTKVKFKKLGIIFLDLSNPNIFNTKSLLT
tara:strand:+ start:970 stop:1380 length:411 start_codon:yes stop_codon:yes gene_type:complete